MIVLEQHSTVDSSSTLNKLRASSSFRRTVQDILVPSDGLFGLYPFRFLLSTPRSVLIVCGVPLAQWRHGIEHWLTVGRSDYTLSELSSQMPIPQFPSVGVADNAANGEQQPLDI